MSIDMLFEAHTGRLIDKWAHYLPIYERYFAKFVGTECRILEIGVGHGGSLQLWKAYFGTRAMIVGLDIDERCQGYEEDQILIAVGNQADEVRLRDLGTFDVVIDDGSHLLSDQSARLRVLWPALNSGGVYLVEDLHGPDRPDPPRDAYSVGVYPWVSVYEKAPLKPERIVTGKPSRVLNNHERHAYAQHLHTNV